MVVEINDSIFNETIKSGIVLIDFWAPWCGPCKMLTPVIEELALELDGKVKIYKFNVDGNTEIPESYQIMSIPSLLLFRDGVLVSQKTGMCPKKIILDWINSSL